MTEKFCRCTLALLLAVPLALSADDYRYIVGNYPPTNESRSRPSGAVALESAPHAVPSQVRKLEARFRDFCESVGQALNTTKPRGCYLIIR